MIEPRHHIEKARRFVAEGHFLLTGGFADGAGRDAYMAAFHAALAYVVMHTGKEPKRHSGTRSEFSRLARGDQRISRAFVAFLGRSYELKASADYDDGEKLTVDDARESLAQAAEMVDAIAGLLPPG